MNIYDENSYPQEQLDGNANVSRGRRKKEKRRSSILKMTKSPTRGLVLDDIDPNAQNSDDATDKSKYSRSCSSRRVSFAETCQIKEIPNEVTKRTWEWEEEGQFQSDKNEAPVPVPEVENTCGNSSYRQPASTLAGLSSLLSSPIQDSPEKARYRQTNEESCDISSLDFTLIGLGVSINEMDVSVNEMDMTSNNTARILIGENAARIQPAQMYSYQAEMQQAQQWQARQENAIAEKITSLDFTRCFGGQDEGDLTSDQMEFTIDHGNGMMVGENSGYILSNTSVRESTSAPREVLREISDEVPTMVNEGYNSWRGAGDEGNDGMRPGALRSAALTSCDDDVSKTKVDGLAFLRHLGGVNVHETSSNQDYLPRETVNDVQRSSVPIPVTPSHDKSSDKIDGAAFCRRLGIGKTRREDTDCSTKLDLTVARGRILNLRENDRFHPGEMEHDSQAFDQTLVADNQDMEMTRCLSNAGAQGRDGRKIDPTIYRDEDYEDMEMTKCMSKVGAQGNDGTEVDPKIHRDEDYEDMEMTRCMSQGMNGSKIVPKIHRDEDYEDMETTRCMPKVGAQGMNGSTIDPNIHRDEDYEDMEITRCMSKVEVQGRNECDVASLVATGADHQDVEMTRCLPNIGRNERKVDLQIHRDKEDTASIRCLPKVWALERNESKVGQQIHREDEYRDMDMTACLPTGERQERNINKSKAEPENVEESNDMEITCRQPLPKVNIVEDNKRPVMDMAACLPTSEQKERSVNKSKAGLENIELSYHMEMTCRQPVPKVNIVEDKKDQEMATIRCLQGNNESKFGLQVVKDENGPVMDMLTCLPTAKRQERDINERKAGPRNVEEDHGLPTIRRQPVQAMSETAPECFNTTSPGECDAMHDTTQSGSETKLIRGDTRSQVIGKTFNNDGHRTETPKDIHVAASSKETSLDVEGYTSSKGYTSVATSTEEPCRLQEWNIDLSHFSKEPAQFAPRDSAAENPETRNVITPGAVRDLKSKDPSNSWLKQANVKRKVPLSSSVNEGMEIKRKAVDGGDIKNQTVSSDDAVLDDVPRLSQTLPVVKSSTAKVVPKKAAQIISVTANFAGSGTHEVVHVGRSIFAAKGPPIGLKHSMLHRRHLSSARLADASGDGDGIKPDPCSMLVMHVPEKSRECEALAGSSAEGLRNPGDCSQVKSPRKESGTVSGVRDGSSNDSVCSAPPPVPLANKFLSCPVDDESFILDESILRVAFDMKGETTEKGMFKDAEQNKSPENLEKKGHAATPNVFDVVRSEIKSAMKKNLSVITEESACDHKTKGDDDQKTRLSDDVGMLSCEYPSNSEEPYTLEEFLSLCNISFIKHVTRRSENLTAAPDLSMEMKDKIYRQCLFEAKSSLWDNFAKDLQAVIAENNQLRTAKEQELNRSNPTVFSELKRSLAVDPENLDVVDKIMALKRACRHNATKYWYDRRKEMDEAVLALLKEQEQILSDDLSRLNNQKKNLDGDISLVDQLTLDLDNKIEDLEVTSESEEKSWNECKKEIEDSKKQLDDLELELQNQEKQREQLASENDSMSRQITDTKSKKAELESEIQSLEEMTRTASCLEATKTEEKYLKSALEWQLEKHEATSLEFRYVYRTFKLDISFEDSQDSSVAAKIKHVNLISRLADASSSVAKLCHQLIIEKFSQCDFVQMFPSRENLPQLLHLVSVPMSKVRLFLEVVDIISINHLVYLNEKQFTIAFSSYKKFIKFLITFDLSNFVNDGILPRTVVKKIGKISSDDIVKQLSDIPSTILCLPKLLKAADEFLN